MEESNLEQGISNQTDVKVVPSTMKSEHFCVKLEVSLEDKVYPKTYYHHNHDDIQVDETLSKNISIKPLNNKLDFDWRITTC